MLVSQWRLTFTSLPNTAEHCRRSRVDARDRSAPSFARTYWNLARRRIMTDTWYHSAGAFEALASQEEFVQPAASQLNKPQASTTLQQDRATCYMTLGCSESAGRGGSEYRAAPRRTASHRNAPHRSVAQRSAPYRTAPRRTAPHGTAPQRKTALSLTGNLLDDT